MSAGRCICPPSHKSEFVLKRAGKKGYYALIILDGGHRVEIDAPSAGEAKTALEEYKLREAAKAEKRAAKRNEARVIAQKVADREEGSWGQFHKLQERAKKAWTKKHSATYARVYREACKFRGVSPK